MKTHLLTLALAALALTASGRTLSPEEALDRLVGESTSAKAPAVNAKTAQKATLLLTESTPAGLPAVYVFADNAANRTLLVSADDVATPLLGYTDRVETSGEMPSQLKWWLSEYARQIAHAQLTGSNTVGSQQVAPASAGTVPFEDGERAAIAPMVKTTWDQDAPYNNDCPKTGGQATVTGCVATAMAQVMKYFQWPGKGRGTGSATVGKQNLTLDLSTITFDWANMLDSYPEATSGTAAQRKAVSQLMIACGYSVEMSYGTAATGGSGASSAYIAPALIKNFNYDSGTHSEDREFYTTAQWNDMIYNNLATCGPLCYSGRSTDGGHAFVCDGYSSDGYFHFNWGWSGMYNGYYTLQALNPDGAGIGGFAGGYNFMQGATLGARRPNGQAATIKPVMTAPYGLNGSASGSYLTIGKGFYNSNSDIITPNIYVKYVATAGSAVKRQKLNSYSAQQLQPNSGWDSFRANLSDAGLSNGTYRVYIETSTTKDTKTFYPVKVPVGYPDHVILTKNGNSYTVSTPASADIDISIQKLFSEIYFVSSSYAIPVMPEATFTLTNTSDTEYQGGIAFQIANGNKAIAYTTGTYVSLAPGESQQSTVKYNVSLRQVPTIGTSYDLYIFNPNTNADPSTLTYSTKVGTVKFVEYPGCTLSMTTAGINGNANQVPADAIPLKGSVRCSQGLYDNSIMAFLYNSDYQQIDYAPLCSLSIKVGETKEINGTFKPATALTPDTDYMILLAYNTGNGWQQLSPYINFHTSKTAAVDEALADGSLHITLTGRTATATGATAIRTINVMATSGLPAAVETSYSGTSATADLSALPAGIYIITATDSAGTSATVKATVK